MLKNAHALSTAEILKELDVDLNSGLVGTDVIQRRKINGENRLIKSEKGNTLKIVLRQFQICEKIKKPRNFISRLH